MRASHGCIRTGRQIWRPTHNLYIRFILFSSYRYKLALYRSHIHLYYLLVDSQQTNKYNTIEGGGRMFNIKFCNSSIQPFNYWNRLNVHLPKNKSSTKIQKYTFYCDERNIGTYCISIQRITFFFNLYENINNSWYKNKTHGHCIYVVWAAGALFVFGMNAYKRSLWWNIADITYFFVIQFILGDSEWVAPLRRKMIFSLYYYWWLRSNLQLGRSFYLWVSYIDEYIDYER